MIGYEIMIIGNNNYHPNRICNAFPCNGMQKHFFMIMSLYHIMGIITLLWSFLVVNINFTKSSLLVSTVYVVLIIYQVAPA